MQEMQIQRMVVPIGQELCYVPVSGLPGFRRPLKGHWWTLIDLNARANDGWLGASKRLTEADGS